MGIDDRDDEYPTRGQSSRRRGAYDNGANSGRSSQRGSRDASYRSRGRGYDDDQSYGRSSGRRDYSRQDDPRSGSRYERDGYDRRGRADQSYPSSSSGRRSRDDWDDRGGRGRDSYAGRGDRTGRNPRPPVRDDWDARPRGGSRGPSPADSSSRGRRPGAALAQSRGGLWDDEPMASAGRRRPNPRDPRAARYGAVEEEEETSGAAAFGKALMMILMALLIGAGASYGYYVISTPKAPAGVSQPTTTPTSKPKTTPTTGEIPSHIASVTQGRQSANVAYAFVDAANRD